MLAVIAAAAVVGLGAFLIGQAVCWACGWQATSFIAPSVGLAVMMAIALLTPHVPGRAWGSATLLLLVLVAAVLAVVREPALRPSAGDLLAVAPAALLVLIPFLTAGHAGTLGVSLDNDMASHLRLAEAYRSARVAAITPIDASYPTGPHALVAVISQVLGARVDYTFAGLTMATPVLLAWTALGSLRRVGWPGRAYVATMVGVPFLIAGFYAEGAFKEVMQALFVLAFAIGLGDLIRAEAARRERGASSEHGLRDLARWVPLGLIVVGSLSVYSVSGLAWLAAGGALIVVVACFSIPSRAAPLGVSWAALRRAAAPAAVALIVLLVVLVPELARLVRFYQHTNGGTGIAVTSLGNLVGPISPWEALGIWDNADFRMPAVDPFHVGMWLTLGLALTVFGLVWWWKRRDVAVPLMALVALAIWIYSDHRESPYVAAKALVILSPLLLLLATRPLVERVSGEPRIAGLGAVRLALVAALGWAVLGTSVDALRDSFVGPTAHIDDLRSIQPLLGRSQTLFLGYDDYIAWELAGTPVSSPVLGGAQLFRERPEKKWTYGQPFDFDFVPSEDLEKFTFVIEPRGASGSETPSNFSLVRETQYFAVFKRVGAAAPREVLDEGPEPGATLVCTSGPGRALSRSRGEAAVRLPNVDVPVPALAPDGSATVRLPLSPGLWKLSTPYTSSFPVSVRAPGLSTLLPANLDRPGARWPIGSVRVPSRQGIAVTFHVQGTWLSVPEQSAMLNTVVATPVAPIVIVPLRRACGRYVDWYRTR